MRVYKRELILRRNTAGQYSGCGFRVCSTELMNSNVRQNLETAGKDDGGRADKRRRQMTCMYS